MKGSAGAAVGAQSVVGRDRALESIGALIDRAGSGRGSALIFEGIAGIGKTTLVQMAVRLAEERGFDVRTATGVPIEAALPFGVLESLLAPERASDALRDRTPSLQAAIGGRELPNSPALLTIAGEVLQLLSTLGRERPVLLAVDDAQWADHSSMAVLGHVARHSVADRIAVIIAKRPDGVVSEEDFGGLGVALTTDAADTEPGRIRSLDAIPVIGLEPLTHAETVTLLVTAGFERSEAERWAVRCGGLPLAIREVGRQGDLAGPDPRDIAALLPDVLRRQVAALTPEVARAALHAAVCDDPAILRSLDRPGLIALLRTAEESGLLRFVKGGRNRSEHIAFRHPLLRAAVLARFSPDEERGVHRVVAEALLLAGEPDRAAIHRASGTDGPDDDAAAAMVAFGDRCHARGATREAAHAWIRSASLQSSPDGRSHLLTRAADSLFDGGDASEAFDVIGEAIRVATDPLSHADASSLKSRMSTWVTSPKDSVRGLDRVAAAVRSVDPARAAAALASASSGGYLDGDLAAAIRRGREAELLAAASGDVVTAATASASLAWNSFMVGEWEEYERRLEPLEPLMRVLLEQGSWAGIHLAELVGMTWVCSERWDDAEPLIRDMLHLTRSMGARLTVASTSLLLGSLCWRRGRWDEAYAIEMPLLEERDFPPITVAWTQVLVAQLLATMGRADETRRLLALGLPVAAAADIPLVVAMGEAALGHLELSLGNDELALAHFDRVADLTDRIGFVEPGYFLWQGDHLDALVRLGREEEARDRVRLLAKVGEAGHRRWVKGVVARTHGQLAGGHTASDSHFEDAVSCFDSLGMPFEVARTLLARGGRQDIDDARRIFLRLGAAVWVDRATRRSEPRGSETGSDAVNGAPRVLELLSAQERNVSLAVVSGRTNREIAAELHLSVKTVDHYLQRAYRRLGVKNRTELATTVSQALSAPRRSTN